MRKIVRSIAVNHHPDSATFHQLMSHSLYEPHDKIMAWVFSVCFCLYPNQAIYNTNPLSILLIICRYQNWSACVWRNLSTRNSLESTIGTAVFLPHTPWQSSDKLILIANAIFKVVARAQCVALILIIIMLDAQSPFVQTLHAVYNMHSLIHNLRMIVLVIRK